MTPQSLLAPARLAGQSVLRTQTDERLVDLVRSGNEPAFEAIVSRYRRALVRYCARFLPEERAEDVVQQTFVNAYSAMRRSSNEISLRSWLYRIAHNTALNALRDRALGHEELDDRYDGVERPDQAVERRQSLRELIASVQALPERQRDAIVLRELEGRSYEEIAGELGVSDGAVRQLLNRARTTLRAGATALTPPGLLTRIPLAEPAEPVSVRVAELVGGAGGGALAAKICATALVTGAVAGGVAIAPSEEERQAPAKAEAAEQQGGPAGGAADSRAGDDGAVGVGADRSGPGDGSGEDRSGRRGGDDDDADDRSGPSDSSGPGPSGGGDSSGPGSGDDDGGHSGSNSGPGSGSDSGSGSSGSGSSGSDSSGSGSSGSGQSGSGSSGSDSSGSGDSGSDSSGSGSGSSLLDDSSGSGSSGSGSD